MDFTFTSVPESLAWRVAGHWWWSTDGLLAKQNSSTRHVSAAGSGAGGVLL